MLPYIHKCLLFGLRKVKTNGNIYIYIEIVLNGLAVNLQSLYGKFNFIASCSFLFVLNIQKSGKDNLLSFDIRSILYYILYIYILISITFWNKNWQTHYIYIYIYMERNKNWQTHYFWITKLQTFQKTIFYCPNHLPSITSYYSQKYFIFYKILWEKKVL